jgi:hypothetical protein
MSSSQDIVARLRTMLTRFASDVTPKSTKQLLISCLVLFILGIAAFTRLWNISGSLEFLGDQGRDALLVQRIFADFDPVFIGPVTSVGNMYLGPLYYYFMLPFLMLSYPSPVGPAYAVAILGIITTGLIVVLGKKLVGLPASILAAALFAIHGVVIQYSRFSWNPNPAPFAALLMVYWTYMAWTKNVRYWILVAVAFSILIQLHYITLLAAAGAGVIFLIQLGESYFKKPLLKRSTQTSSITNKEMYIPNTMSLLKMIPIGILLVLVTLTPLFLFDLKNGGLNQNAFTNLVIKEDAFKDSRQPILENITQSLAETQGRSIHMLGELNFGFNRTFNTILIGVFFLTAALLLLTPKNKYKAGHIVLLSFLLTGILGTAFYRGSLFNHYISYLFPVILMSWAVVLHQWIRWNAIAIIPVAIWIGAFTYYNVQSWDFETKSWSIYDIERTAESITTHIEPDTPYTIVLLTGTGDLHGMNYRYYLTTKGYAPLGFEAIQQVEKLIIINEDQPNFSVADTNIHEIAVFPSTSNEFRYTIENGPEIIILEK